MRTLSWFLVLFTYSVVTDAAWSQSPFATRVVSFDPAPGTFAQNDAFNDADRAVGAPHGGTLSVPDNTSIVSLGAFGGSITLGFDHTVLDHPLNPYGVDAIVFGNSFFPGSDEQVRWGEAGVIEISRDANGNGIADDAWYLIEGSHVDALTSDYLVVTWDADTSDSMYPPSLESWLPPGSAVIWETGSFELPVDVFGSFIVGNPSADLELEGIFGYADFSPTLLLGDVDGDGTVDDVTAVAAEFYTTPDDPISVGMTLGSGGGDGFDIGWAVDEVTGVSAELDGFDFIRITTAVFAIDRALGEISTEVDAVSDVSPDLFGDADGDEDVDLRDLSVVLGCLGVELPDGGDCLVLDRDGDGVLELDEVGEIVVRVIGPEWGGR